jgi:hypothetical protein
MSKSIASILTVGAIIGLQVFPGVGQALGAAIAGTIGIGATTAATAAAIAQIAVVGAGALAQTLLPGVKAARAEMTEQAQRTPISPCVSGYGEGRMYLDYALFVTAADGTAVDVGAIHDGRVDSITGYYLGDKKVTLTSGGYVAGLDDGQFGDNDDNVQIGATLGPAINTAFAPVVAKIPDIWTADHRGDGIVTAFVLWKAVKSKNYPKVYSGGGPNNMPLSLVLRMQLVFDWRDASQSVTDPMTWNWSENAILHLAHYLLVRDNKDWSKHFAPTLAYWTAAANVCDEPVALKGVQTVTTAGGQDGDGYVEVGTVAGLVAGMQIVIAATGDTSATETRTVGSVAGLRINFADDLDNDHPIGSRVSWASSESAPATEPRYRGCVVHKHTDEHKAVVAALLACCDGWMSPRADGALVVYAGRFTAPTVTVDDRDVVSYSVQDGIEEENAVNTIPLTYVSRDHDYTTVDTDAWVDEDDIERRGKELASGGLANQVPSHSQARRLGKRAYAEAMAGKRGTCTLRSTGRKILGQRYIRLVLSEIGFDETVQVKAPVKRDPTTGQVSFAWILADPNVDAWNPLTEEGNPAPVGNIVAGEPLETPSIISATAMYTAVGSTPEGDEPIDPTPGQTATGARILVAANGLDREDVTWSGRWRVGTSGSWSEREYADADPGPAVSFLTEFVPLATNINVEVAYSVGDGRLSDWSDPVVVNTTTG